MPRFGGMLAGAAALALVVGTATAEAKTEVRVTLAYYSDQTEGIFKGMADDFMKAHPDIDIKLETVHGTTCSSGSPPTSPAAPRPTSRSSARAGWSTTSRTTSPSRSTPT